jgi:hypothetical protein
MQHHKRLRYCRRSQHDNTVRLLNRRVARPCAVEDANDQGGAYCRSPLDHGPIASSQGGWYEIFYVGLNGHHSAPSKFVMALMESGSDRRFPPMEIEIMSVVTFTDPEPYQAAINPAQVEILVTAKGACQSALAGIALKRLRLQRGRESLPRVAKARRVGCELREHGPRRCRRAAGHG